jgi:hypothetical protein
MLIIPSSVTGTGVAQDVWVGLATVGWYHPSRHWQNGCSDRDQVVGLQEYILLVLVILVPLVIATVVTLWTLEQARMRSRKNRKRSPKGKSGSATPPGAS